MIPMTIKYDNKSKNRDFNLFVEEYFGGSDVFIYIDGRREHNISHIQFAIQERHKPIYGYGSRTFDDVAIGDRIVVGAMKVPIKNTNEQLLEKHDYAPRSIQQYEYVPDWVYNYIPDKDQPVNENNNKDDIIMEIQRSLNINETGILDFDTKVAIAKCRSNIGLSPGCYIDNDLLNEINNNYMGAVSNGEIKVYDSPSLSKIINIIPPSSQVVVSAHNDDVFLIRDKNGQSGFINKDGVDII